MNNNRFRRLPALRSQIGVWAYYVCTMSFEDVATYVSPINDELHKSSLLSEMIQRSITENYKEIAKYLVEQEERFFNALILAVYNGEPTWNEIRIDDADSSDEHGLGLLSLTGEEKIFPVDGQHRVEGIKKAIEMLPELSKERVPVIFVGHSKDNIGMQRTRRLFSTLNRYAKPVSLRDIIALDEDDVVAIASRNIIDSTNLFGEDRILDAKTKAIPDTNKRSLTSLITYYECNKELLWLRVKEFDVIGVDGKKIKGHGKINEFIKHRPSDEFIEIFTKDCIDYWNSIISFCNNAFETETIAEYRSKEGGHVFFRPAALIPFTKAVVKIIEKDTEADFAKIISRLHATIFWIQNEIWKNILWNPLKKEMIMGNSKLVELLFIYDFNSDLLSSADKKKICSEIRGLKTELNKKNDNEVIEYINEQLSRS